MFHLSTEFLTGEKKKKNQTVCICQLFPRVAGGREEASADFYMPVALYAPVINQSHVGCGLCLLAVTAGRRTVTAFSDFYLGGGIRGFREGAGMSIILQRGPFGTCAEYRSYHLLHASPGVRGSTLDLLAVGGFIFALGSFVRSETQQDVRNGE